jgi:hypothetical protein
LQRFDLPLQVLSAVFCSVVLTYSSLAQSNSTQEPETVSRAIQLFSSPDDSSAPAGLLSEREPATPIAVTLGTGGEKWYLVKTKAGVIGWLKQSAHAQAINLEQYFKSLPPEVSSNTPTIPSVTVTTTARSTIIVPVHFLGRAALVGVTLNRSVNGNLIVDTGASNTVISRRLATLLSLRQTGATIGQTVGGPISAVTAQLKSIKVGAAEVTDLSVIVHDFSRDPRVEGLLGMDFLGRYQVGLDAQKQLLVLSPR